MFKRKPKLDPKVRFQQKSFRDQLQNAKEYKRNVRKFSENQLQMWLQKLGLKSLLTQMLLGALVLAVLYFIYIPNFLFVKTVEVRGLTTAQTLQAESVVWQFLKAAPMQARDNMLFVPKTKLAEDLTEKDNDILAVLSVSRNFPNTLVVTVKPRQNAFLVSTTLQKMVVSTDGLVRQQLDIFSTSTPPEFSNLTPIALANASSTNEGDKIFSDDLSRNLLAIIFIVNQNQSIRVQKISLENADSKDMTITTTLGYEIRVNTDQDLEKIKQALQLVLSTIGPREKDLYYIDMRFPERVFTCYKNTACANDKAVLDFVTPTSSTTTFINLMTQ